MFGILLAGVGDHMGTVLRRAVAKIETLFLVRTVFLDQEPTAPPSPLVSIPDPQIPPPQEPFQIPSWWRMMKISGGQMHMLCVETAPW